MKLGIVVRCLGSLIQDWKFFLVWSCVYVFLMESGRGLGLTYNSLWLDGSRTKFSGVKLQRLLRLCILFFNDKN